MNEIRNQILNKKIWVSIDETTDIEGRYTTNVIIGTLLTDGLGKILLASEVLEKANTRQVVNYLIMLFFLCDQMELNMTMLFYL
jgi:hypothetical protein